MLINTSAAEQSALKKSNAFRKVKQLCNRIYVLYMITPCCLFFVVCCPLSGNYLFLFCYYQPIAHVYIRKVHFWPQPNIYLVETGIDFHSLPDFEDFVFNFRCDLSNDKSFFYQFHKRRVYVMKEMLMTHLISLIGMNSRIIIIYTSHKTRRKIIIIGDYQLLFKRYLHPAFN